MVGTNRFHAKAKNERFTADSRICQNFHVVIWQTTSKHCTKKRAARAVQLFFLIQPIKSLICGAGVRVAVVVDVVIP